VAKSSLIGDQKFQLLVHRLGIPKAHVLGHLELMWQTAYSSFSPILRTREAIEITAGWCGTEGVFAEAVLNPAHNFVDARDDGQFEIHDFWEHAPDFVKKRYMRQLERKQQLIKRRSVRTYSGGQNPTMADNGGQCLPTEPNPTQPNPTQAIKADPPDPPAPIPAPKPASENRPSAQLPEPQKPKPKPQPQTSTHEDPVEIAVSRLLEFETERNRGPSVALMWRMRVRAMARLPDGLFAVSKMCDECETRRNPRAAETKGYSKETIRDEPAWLNQQTSQWLKDHQPATARSAS